jgi:hypothetical protein
MKLVPFFPALAVTLFIAPLLSAAEPASFRPRCADRTILEPEARIDGRLLVPAFYRPAERNGYLWVETQRDEYGRCFPGYWEPVGPYLRKGGEMAWVPGRFQGGRWSEGYWRMPAREGYSWLNGYFDENGRWHEPGWKTDDPVNYFPDGPARLDDVRLCRSTHPRWCYCSVTNASRISYPTRSFSLTKWYPTRSSCFWMKDRPIETLQNKETIAP